MIIIDPRGMGIVDWIDSSTDNLSSFVHPMKVEKDEDWVEWGEYVRQSLVRRGILTPDPRQFPQFEEWASRFNQIIQNI